MGVKVKYQGRWVDPEYVAYLRAQEQPRTAPPAVDVAALPARTDLDPDVPLEQLFFEQPEVRAYITKSGQIRSGLTVEQQATAEAIVARYNPLQFDEADHPNPEQENP